MSAENCGVLCEVASGAINWGVGVFRSTIVMYADSVTWFPWGRDCALSPQVHSIEPHIRKHSPRAFGSNVLYKVFQWCAHITLFNVQLSFCGSSKYNLGCSKSCTWRLRFILRDHSSYWSLLAPSIGTSGLIMWKVASQHLFLNRIPNKYAARSKQKGWCDRTGHELPIVIF